MFAGSAFANFGPHGGYVNDTDACAGCHRAHTSFSTVGWTDGLGTQHASALLVGSASTMTEFCNACHGDAAPGASTNVASGVFDSGPSAGNDIVTGLNKPGAILGDVNASWTATVGATSPDQLVYGAGANQVITDSQFGAPLNGGGFDRMPDPYAWQSGGNTVGAVNFVASSSVHNMDAAGPLWGSGSAVTQLTLTCTDCHDPHGSSNYRLLKAKPNPAGPVVGGYGADNETPNAFVFSNETGYPVPQAVYDSGNPGGGVPVPGYSDGGWLKHADGAAQVANYRPNYTDTTGTPILHTDMSTSLSTKSMSTWCSACHMNYNQITAGATTSYDYSPYMPLDASGASALPQLGVKDYHRHATNQNMAAGIGATRALAEQWVPLETPGSGLDSFANSYIGCLTCHRAHGSSAAMSGWSSAHLVANAAGTYMPAKDSIPGVDPDKGTTANGTSALLRANNRGVCERCHNK
jgi:hypothetical protein